MAKFKVSGSVTFEFEYEVEADHEDLAEIAVAETLPLAALAKVGTGHEVFIEDCVPVRANSKNGK